MSHARSTRAATEYERPKYPSISGMNGSPSRAPSPSSVARIASGGRSSTTSPRLRGGTEALLGAMDIKLIVRPGHVRQRTLAETDHCDDMTFRRPSPSIRDKVRDTFAEAWAAVHDDAQ